MLSKSSLEYLLVEVPKASAIESSLTFLPRANNGNARKIAASQMNSDFYPVKGFMSWSCGP